MKPNPRCKNLITLALLILIAVLLLSNLGLEHDRKTESPLHGYYLETYHATGSANLVESILLNYRAYDTFGEVMVLYITVAGILILGEKEKGGERG